jgi:hypothetical protein
MDDEHVEVWGPPEMGLMPRDGRWCDEAALGQALIYHREPNITPHEHWFCTRCGSSTWSDEQTGEA